MYRTMVQTDLPKELEMILNEVGQRIDDTNHVVQSWAVYVAALLEHLELFAMANDAHHPEQYELMLTRLNDQIAARLKKGIW